MTRAGTRLGSDSELNELAGVVGEVELFGLGDEADAPLLHGEGAEEDLDGPAVFVVADAVDDHGLGVEGLAGDLAHEHRGLGRFFGLAAELGKALSRSVEPPSGVEPGPLMSRLMEVYLRSP